MKNPNGKLSVTIDGAERATILAALLFYQENGMGEPANRALHIHDCATANDQEISLDERGVAELFVTIAQI